MLPYPGRLLVHDPQFDRDCERVFGSLETADDELAQFMFDVGHDVVTGAAISQWVSVFVVAAGRPCLVVVESLGDHLLLRALVAVERSMQAAA